MFTTNARIMIALNRFNSSLTVHILFKFRFINKCYVETRLIIVDKYVKTIDEYYTNLIGYGINKKKALRRTSDLSLKLKFKDASNFANRLCETASIIQDNFSIFVSVCEYKEVVISIIDSLNFGIQLKHDMTEHIKFFGPLGEFNNDKPK